MCRWSHQICLGALIVTGLAADLCLEADSPPAASFVLLFTLLFCRCNGFNGGGTRDVARDTPQVSSDSTQFK